MLALRVQETSDYFKARMPRQIDFHATSETLPAPREASLDPSS